MSNYKEGFISETNYYSKFSLLKVYDALGLIREAPKIISPDTSLEAIAQKIVVPGVARAMGASNSTVALIQKTAMTSHLVDSFSETGERSFLIQADTVFDEVISSLPIERKGLILDLSKSALTYFYFEAAIARRIANGDQFLEEEAIEYLLQRGADSIIFAALLQADNISSPGLISGFRARQALKDLRDDVEDLEQDKMTVGANVLLLSTRGNKRTLRRFANQLLQQGRTLDIPKPLRTVIEGEYEMATMALRMN